MGARASLDRDPCASVECVQGPAWVMTWNEKQIGDDYSVAGGVSGYECIVWIVCKYVQLY